MKVRAPELTLTLTLTLTLSLTLILTLTLTLILTLTLTMALTRFGVHATAARPRVAARRLTSRAPSSPTASELAVN